MLTLYTDGSSLGNPGPGGWGVIILKSPGIKNDIMLSGGEQWTTNNRMELLAVINALLRIDQQKDTKQQYKIYMDSKYVYDGIQDYLPQRIARGWKLANKKPVLNKDLWMQLHTLLQNNYQITWAWVKAHATNAHNNKVDKLARSQAIKQQSALPANFVPPPSSNQVVDNAQPSLF